jgi:hypothetical protein
MQNLLLMGMQNLYINDLVSAIINCTPTRSPGLRAVDLIDFEGLAAGGREIRASNPFS